MALPQELLQACESLLNTIPLKQLEEAAQELSESYRTQTLGVKPRKAYMQKKAHKLAYLALRFPATYAAILECLEKMTFPIQSLLDVGSGPGTALWAASSLWKVKNATLIEQDPELLQISEKLDVHKSFPVERIKGEIQNISIEKEYDLVTCAYSLSELSDELLESVLDKLWKATKSYLFLIEPGTPYGFRVIHAARSFLIQKGGLISAPCTHEKGCPLFQRGDWCHFAKRFERTELQRKVKNATLGYEDEKYSYLIVSKHPLKQPYARIVKTPEKHSGHLKLVLCSEKGLEEKIISRRDGEAYTLAKKLSWGDAY